MGVSPPFPHPYFLVPRAEWLRRSDGSAAEWIENNLERGKVVTRQYVGSSDWSQQNVYTTGLTRLYPPPPPAFSPAVHPEFRLRQRMGASSL